MKTRFLLVFASIALALIFQHTNAATLDCTSRNATECKTLFAETFDTESQEILLQGQQNIHSKYLNYYKLILADLPTAHPYIEPLQELIHDLELTMEYMKYHANDTSDIVGIIVGTLDKAEPIFDEVAVDANTKEIYKGILENHRQIPNSKELFNISNRILALWISLYNDMSNSNSETYPDIEELNKKYMVVYEMEDSSSKTDLFFDTLRKTAADLKLRFLRIFFYRIDNRHY